MNLVLCISFLSKKALSPSLDFLFSIRLCMRHILYVQEKRAISLLLLFPILHNFSIFLVQKTFLPLGLQQQKKKILSFSTTHFLLSSSYSFHLFLNSFKQKNQLHLYLKASALGVHACKTNTDFCRVGRHVHAAPRYYHSKQSSFKDSVMPKFANQISFFPLELFVKSQLSNNPYLVFIFFCTKLINQKINITQMI